MDQRSVQNKMGSPICRISARYLICVSIGSLRVLNFAQISQSVLVLARATDAEKRGLQNE